MNWKRILHLYLRKVPPWQFYRFFFCLKLDEFSIFNVKFCFNKFRDLFTYIKVFKKFEDSKGNVSSGSMTGPDRSYSKKNLIIFKTHTYSHSDDGQIIYSWFTSKVTTSSQVLWWRKHESFKLIYICFFWIGPHNIFFF